MAWAVQAASVKGCASAGDRQGCFVLAVLGRSGKPYATGVPSVSDAVARLAALGGALKSKSAPKAVEIALVFIIAVILARIILALAAPLPLPQGNVQASAPSSASAGPGAVKSPFPAAAAPEIAAANGPSAEEVAETTLDLTLTGVMIWPNPESASATILTPEGRQQRFAIGDVIVPGVTLEAVYADQAIIDSSGVRESLRFESKLTADQLSDPPSAPQGLQERPEPQTAAAPEAKTPGTVTPGTMTAESIGRLASVLRVAPGMNAQGELVMELYAARDRTAFSALGLEDGDRLVAVNGAPAPTDPAALTATLNQLQRADQASIVVERNGEDVRLQLSLPDLLGD